MRLYRIFFISLLLYSCNPQEKPSKPNPLTAPNNIAQPAANSIEKDTLPSQLLNITPPDYLTYFWKTGEPIIETLQSRIAPPKGYKRIPLKKESFGEWLRYLPLQKAGAPVHLYTGSLKGNQRVHHAVVDMDVGTTDLQQCADAVMRLKAEYHYSTKDYQSIHFNYTSGDNVSFDRWRKGSRPKVDGNKVRWVENGSVSNSYNNFKTYLKQIFNYAGTASLSKEMQAQNINDLMPGDVFIKGGFPGHAVLVLDVAVNNEGDKIFLIGQSYMPAQEFHVLKNPNNNALSPWYNAHGKELLETPEWTFKINDLKKWRN